MRTYQERVQKLEWTLAQPFISTWQPPKASQPKSHVQVVEVSDTELLNKKDKEIDILKELLAKQEMAPADSTMQSQLVTKDELIRTLQEKLDMFTAEDAECNMFGTEDLNMDFEPELQCLNEEILELKNDIFKRDAMIESTSSRLTSKYEAEIHGLAMRHKSEIEKLQDSWDNERKQIKFIRSTMENMMTEDEAYDLFDRERAELTRRHEEQMHTHEEQMQKMMAKMETFLDEERATHQKQLLEYRKLSDLQLQDKDKPGKKKKR